MPCLLKEWTPTDFNPKPSLVDRVSDPLFKKWVEDLNYIFLNLSRKIKPDVKVNPGFYSLLYVPNGYVYTDMASKTTVTSFLITFIYVKNKFKTRSNLIRC